MMSEVVATTPEERIAAEEAEAAKAAKIAAVRARKAAAQKPNELKDLKIKISVVKRMANEVTFYHKEVGENEAIVQQLKDEGKDEYDLKQAVRTQLLTPPPQHTMLWDYKRTIF